MRGGMLSIFGSLFNCDISLSAGNQCFNFWSILSQFIRIFLDRYLRVGRVDRIALALLEEKKKTLTGTISQLQYYLILDAICPLVTCDLSEHRALCSLNFIYKKSSTTLSLPSKFLSERDITLKNFQ